MKHIRIRLIILALLVSTLLFSITPPELMKIDYNSDYSSRKVNELRLIRSMVMAKHGYLFKKSELRDYFMSNFKWYDSLVWHNAVLEWDGKKVPPITYSDKEIKFIAKIDTLIAQKCRKNYLIQEDDTVPNLDNLYNQFDYKIFTPEFKKVLGRYGFVIVKDKYEQLFHLYDQNQYSYISSFVTTDLYLQLLHTYFSYTLKLLEKEKLVDLVTQLTKSMYNESIKYSGNKDEEIRELADFNACYFAIAYKLLTNNDLKIPENFQGKYEDELKSISGTADGISPLFESYMPYSLCIPRGHYTRTEEQKRYFKAMIWLQVAPYCLSDDFLLKQACFNAFLLNTGKSESQKPLMDIYKSVYEPIAFLIGDADNLSVTDICDYYNKNNIVKIESLSQKKVINEIIKYLTVKAKEKDQIQPKLKLACHPKINFMPQRYLVDNDILQQFVDTTKNAKKAFPKALEVLSVLGIESAKNVLYYHYNENQKWDQYESIMQQQRSKFNTFDNWDMSVYNKWLQALIKLNKTDKTYPYFMKNRGWKLKNLNTSLASYAELKHDVILYGEQPMAAEMGDGGDELPPPVTYGYVEPNLEFWNACKDMLEKCDAFLTKYDLKTEELTHKSKAVKDILEFFIKVSNKELKRETLTDEEYETIEFISGRFDYLSLSLLNPYISYSDWYEVKGPDKTIALVADIYTRNIPDCPRNGYLHEATGLGNTIYVVVEIEDRFYLMRGATFSYYEFPYNTRLTDEKWLEMVNKNQIKPVEWMNEVTIEGISSKK